MNEYEAKAHSQNDSSCAKKAQENAKQPDSSLQDSVQRGGGEG